MQGNGASGAFVFFDFVDLLVQPEHHVAIMQQQGSGRRVIVAQLVQARRQHLLVRQRALKDPFGKRPVLDFRHPAKLRIVVPFHLGKRTQQLVEFDHAVKRRQRAGADHFLQRMARLPNQLDHPG